MEFLIALFVLVAAIWLMTHAGRGIGKAFTAASREINQTNPERER